MCKRNFLGKSAGSGLLHQAPLAEENRSEMVKASTDQENEEEWNWFHKSVVGEKDFSSMWIEIAGDNQTHNCMWTQNIHILGLCLGDPWAVTVGGGFLLVEYLIAQGSIQYCCGYCRGLCHCVAMEVITNSHLDLGRDFWFCQVHLSWFFY